APFLCHGSSPQSPSCWRGLIRGVIIVGGVTPKLPTGANCVRAHARIVAYNQICRERCLVRCQLSHAHRTPLVIRQRSNNAVCASWFDQYTTWKVIAKNSGREQDKAVRWERWREAPSLGPA